MNKPQPQIITIWRISLTLASLFPAFLISLLLRIGSTPWAVTAGVFISLFLILYLVYFPLLYRKTSFGVKNGKFILTTGVIFNRVIALPISEIQFVTVARSIFSRFFGLSSVIAAAPGARLRISGLKATDADNLALVLKPNGN